MGSTIRREPVSFGIPKKPKYQFSNITEFGGLNITDNPFTAPTNTASDMLNVYVDEANALTTRPRLEKKYDYHELIENHPEILNVYPIVNGFLIHCKLGVMYKLYLHSLKFNKICRVLCTDETLIPKENFVCFESDGKINIISNEKYLHINLPITRQDVNGIVSSESDLDDQYPYGSSGWKAYCSSDFTAHGTSFTAGWLIESTGNGGEFKLLNANANTLTEVEGYVPTAKIGVKKYDANNNPYFENGIDYEQLNLLSDEYIEKQFWDGNDVLAYSTENLKSVENNYYFVINSEEERLLCSSSKGIFLTNTSSGYVYKYVYNNNTQSWDKSKFTDSLYSSLNRFVMADSTARVIEYDDLNGNLTVYDWSDFENKYSITGYIYNTNQTSSNKIPVNSDDFRLSDDGTIVTFFNGYLSYPSTTLTGSYSLNLTTNPKTVSKLSLTSITNYTPTFYSFYNTNDHTYMTETLLSDSLTQGYVKIQIYSDLQLESTLTFNLSGFTQLLTHYKEYIRAYLLGNYKLLLSSPNKIFLYDITNSSSPSLLRTFSISNWHRGFSFDTQHNNLFVYERIPTNGSLTSEDVTNINVFDLNGIRKSVILYTIPNITSLDDFYKNRFLTYTDFKFFTLSNTDGSGLGDRFTTILHYKESTEPELKLTYSAENLPEQNTKRLERREKFLKSTLTKRWNNEQWFASGNTLFRTVNNDPTYIGLTSFTDLGNTEETITGFNIAQDNLFLVYKNDRIYAVQYGEVLENTYDYQYTETKNNVGNDAPGNCIVSTLTEMPLQVSYDGIYALNQLQNVLTSDRICVPISDSINVKWLKETKNAIENCITLNRLYWTYFILTYKRSDYGVNYNKEFDFVGTKVYLLDNRSGQWFYWELPIITVNAFSKDNKTHFVDKDGNVYTLETDDIINKYNNELTEYYDDGGKLIPWKWVSQIMPLGTINYSKRLIDTTFILTDTDTTDEYGLVYKFKSFRKMASQTSENTINNKLNYVQSVTKKTLIPRCNFIQLELSNIEDDKDNNKLRLIGLGFRYVLLEGLY